MKKITKVNSLDPYRPWVFTLVNNNSLQVTKILALGRSQALAEMHLRKVFSDSDWRIDRCYLVGNKSFLCNADYSYPNVLIDF